MSTETCVPVPISTVGWRVKDTFWRTCDSSPTFHRDTFNFPEPSTTTFSPTINSLNKLIALLLALLPAPLLAVNADAAQLSPEVLDAALAKAYGGDDRALRQLTSANFTYRAATVLPGEVYFSYIIDFIDINGELRSDTLSVQQNDEQIVIQRRLTSGKGDRPSDREGIDASWRLTETFSVKNGKLSAVAVALAATDAKQTTEKPSLQRPQKFAYQPLPARTIAAYEAGVFLECVAPGPADTVYVSLLFSNEIWHIDSAGKTATLAQLPIDGKPQYNAGLVCIDVGDNGDLYATVAGGENQHGVWKIPGDGKTPYRVAKLPSEAQPNGIAVDPYGRIWIADSLGAIWLTAIDSKDSDAQLWLRSQRLRARPFVGLGPGANGINFHGDKLFVTVSDKAEVLAIAIAGDGSTGAIDTYHRGVGGDDFTVTKDGTLYISTHPFNTVVEVKPDKSTRIVAGVAEAVIGAADVTVKSYDGKEKLIVVGDGGLFAPIEGRAIEPTVVELSLTNQQ